LGFVTDLEFACSLRNNSKQSHEATLAQLVSLQNLFTEAQTKLDHLTSLTVAPPPAPTTTEQEIPAILLETDHSPSPGVEADSKTPASTATIEEQPRHRRTLEEVRTIDDAWILTKEKVEEHETLAVGIAGTIGGLLLAGLYSALTR
jgi:hypothetical protein